MDGLQVDIRVSLKVFSQLGNEYVHASAQEIIVLAPYIHQHLLPFEDTVGMFAEEFKQVCFLLREIEYFLVDGELEVGIRELQGADREEYCFVRVHFPGPS